MSGRLRRLVSNGGLFHSSVQTVSSVALSIVLTLITGVMTARLLGPSGRGELAAIVTLNQTLGWIVSMGCFQAVVYHSSRHRESASEIVSTWVLLAIPAGIAGVIAGELLIETLFRAQSPEVLELGRLWLLLMPLNPISEALSGALVARRDFAATNSLRLLQPIISVCLLTALWLTGSLTVATALLAQAIMIFTYLALLTIRVHRKVSFGRPRRHLATSGLWYAVRAHTSNIGGQVNARFDLAIMPAFLSAAQIGLYAVAVSASSMIVTLASSLGQIVQPVAASNEEGSDRNVCKLFHATIIIGVVVAAPVAVLAPWLLTLVYSSAFEPASTPLRLLAPGAVLLAMMNVLVVGLFGKNRPATGGFAQLPGAIFMVVALLLLLGSGGIALAATVSTISYGISMIIAAVAYLRVSETSARELFDPRPTIRELIDRLRARRRGATTDGVRVGGTG